MLERKVRNRPIADIETPAAIANHPEMVDTKISDLKTALFAASTRLDEAVRRLAPKHVGGEMAEWEAAFQALMKAERKLASAEQRPYAIPSDNNLSWDVGAPLPTLIQSDNQVFLFFVLPDDDANVCEVEFTMCWSTLFGSPGDETFEGHPLHGSGFEPYRLMEVINSPWIAKLRQIDSVHPRHNAANYSSAKHFIFPFHDTTFECVARSFKVQQVRGPLSEAVKRVVGTLY